MFLVPLESFFFLRHRSEHTGHIIVTTQYRTKKIASLLLLISLTFGTGNAFSLDNPFERYQTDEHLKEKISDFLRKENIRSLQEYREWLSKNVVYKADQGEDDWSTPLETLHNRFGDCEDLAFLNQAILTALGYSAEVLASVNTKRAHAFCVFKINQYYQIFDNTNLIKTHATSLNTIINYVLAQEKSYLLFSLDMDLKQAIVLYKKPHVPVQHPDQSPINTSFPIVKVIEPEQTTYQIPRSGSPGRS